MSWMSRQRFERLVAQAIDLIPSTLRREMRNVAVVVEDEPAPDVLADLGIEPPDTLYGLYEGTPLTERTWGDPTAIPDRITIFQRPIEADAEDDQDIVRAVGETVIHEFGHHFGLSEEEIEAIEADYWQTPAADDEPDAPR